MNARYGRLVIPANANIITCEDGELGVLRRVKKTTYLYSTIPSSALIKASQEKATRHIRLGQEKFPAMICAKSGEESAGVFGELSENEEVLARRVQGCPGVFEVVIFKKIDNRREDMPETGDAIDIVSKGYVLDSDLGTPLRRAKFKGIHAPIFQNENLADDVKQHSFGDCFLLASVLAILSKEGGADYIRSMMIQDGDHTIVRLYDPTTLLPLYVHVQNSFYSENGKSAVKHQAPWVHILEKAYAAAGFKQQDKQFVVSFPAFREMYGDGGHPTTALSVLTGQPAERNKVVIDRSYPWTAMDWMLCMSVYVQAQTLINQYANSDPAILSDLDAFLSECSDDKLATLISQLREVEVDLGKLDLPESLKEKLGAATAETKAILLNDVLSYVEKYHQLWRVEKPQITEVFKTIGEMSPAGAYIHGLLLQGNLSEFVQIEKPVEHFRDVQAYFEAINLFNPAPPAGVMAAYKRFVDEKTTHWSLPEDHVLYNDEANELYNGIVKAFCQPQQGTVLIASTKDVLPGDTFPGLRPRHAYAITGVCEEPVAGGSIHKFVKVRNPWGHTGIKYQGDDHQGVTVVEDVESAEFKVELSHFIEYFSSYTSGGFRAVPILSQQEQQGLNNIYTANDALLATTPFLHRHGVKMLLGAIAATALVVAGLLTFGAALLVTIGVPVLIAAIAGVSVLVGAAVGAGAGALLGKAEDAIVTEEKQQKPKGRDASFIFASLKARPVGMVDGVSSDEEETSSEEVFSSKEVPSPHPNFKTIQVVPVALMPGKTA